MRTVIKVPKIGMTMVDATIAKVCKQPGEAFRKGDPLFEIETDKVAHAVEATADGSSCSSTFPTVLDGPPGSGDWSPPGT